jgi:hypothetical protein
VSTSNLPSLFLCCCLAPSPLFYCSLYAYSALWIRNYLMAPSLNVDECIETLKSGECVSERSLRLLCAYVSELLMEESNVQPVLSPVTIVGGLHGQFFDLLQLLQVGGWPPDTCYIFLGDFVDRGHNSVETLSLLLCLKLKYPGHITLLRGNHEVCLFAGIVHAHIYILPFFTHVRDRVVRLRKFMDFTMSVCENTETRPRGDTACSALIALAWLRWWTNKFYVYMVV